MISDMLMKYITYFIEYIGIKHLFDGPSGHIHLSVEPQFRYT